MADLTEIRNALATLITQYTGLRAEGQARDQISPPVAVVLPSPTFITYGATMDEAFTVNLMVLLCISDAAPVEKTQRALDAYLGFGKSDDVTVSVAEAILMDTTLAGTVHFCEPVTVSNYGRIQYAGQEYFGARINLTCGAI
jgi:hypothetical protein